ncbi:MAG: CstA-like transporter-associated (seleno)protein [Rheinheimera sp.]|nr:CstA-like transporter-associated (seleno)protein [Rheinheimera sp.]
MRLFIKKCWALLRQLSGDDAYERYLRHQAHCASG